MNRTDFLIGVLIEESNSLSFKEACHRYQISEEVLMEMIEYGLFSEQPLNKELLQLNQKDLRRMESAFRLHQDLGVNLPGVALALDLLEKIDSMHHELRILRKHF